jgi:hypothetical protein
MFAAINWENVNIAGAFVLGAILASLATIRVVRAVSVVLRREARSDRDDDRERNG